MYEYNAKVLRVIDGDTIDVEIDVGFSIFIKNRLRLEGIDAPETRTRDLVEKKEGLKAKQRLIELIEGKEVIIRTSKDEKYGRILATVYLDGVNICQQLLDENLARVYK